MIYSITASRDTTLYEKVEDTIFSSSMNTGIDEILELDKHISGSLGLGPYSSRIIIKFDIPDSVNSGSDSSNTFTNPDGTQFTPPTSFLNLYATSVENLGNATDRVYVKAVSQSWSDGTGRRTNKYMTKEGASWLYKDGYKDGTWWTQTDGAVSGLPSPGASTHSISGITTPAFQFDSATTAYDIRKDVTQWVAKFTGSGGVYGETRVDNNGFLLVRDSEADGTIGGKLLYYSTNTHTIYQPRLEFCWDDSKWATGSLNELSTTDASSIFLYLKNNRGNYKYGEKTKFRIVGREKYPTKTYGTTSANLDITYLPSGSAFYSVKDLKTGETVIPYDNTFTKMSCDSIGNYFEMFTTNLYSERYYQIEIKLFESGSTTNTIGYYPLKDVFKVVR